MPQRKSSYQELACPAQLARHTAATKSDSIDSPIRIARRKKVSGNAALQGARELLLSRTRRESIERVIRTIEHVELETTPDFFELFVEGCQFKPMEANWPS